MEEKDKVQYEKAKFSLSGATLYGINAVIGSGIFLLPRNIYKDLGPASLAVMLGTAILVIMLAVCFAEVAGYVNKNGGAYQYSKRAFGEFVGFNVGILGWAVTMIAWSAMASGFARIFILTFPAFKGHNLLISIALIVLLSLMNIAGLRTSKVFTITVTIAKLIPIIGFALCAIFFIPKGISEGNFTPFVQLSEGSNLSSAIATTAIYIFYGFIGFETLPIVAGEMRNAEKNVPKAILGSISIVSILYMLIIGGTIAMLGVADLCAAQGEVMHGAHDEGDGLVAGVAAEAGYDGHQGGQCHDFGDRVFKHADDARGEKCRAQVDDQPQPAGAEGLPGA